ncbi:MAG TPA: hypothetical protein VFM10_09900, partial [Terriglobales bacterium]|nr:hypothetical protein [Terriglobales bacterium]
PEPGAAAPGSAEAVPEAKQTTPEAKAVMAKVVDALGGEAKVGAVKAIHESATNTVNTPQGEMQIKVSRTVVYPDRNHSVVNTPMGEMTMVYTPTAAFMTAGGRTQDMPASRRAEGLNNVKRDLLNLAQHVNDPKYAFVLGPNEKAGSVDATVVDVNADGASLRLYVDPKSGRVLRESFSSTGPSGPAQMMTDFSDWQTVDGITLPMQRTTTANGQKLSSEKIESIQINPAVDPKMFEKTAAAPAS